MAIDTGTDTSTYDATGNPFAGFDAPEIEGVTVILQDVAHIITTQRGALFWDTTVGVSTPAQDLLNATPTDAELVNIAGDWSQSAAEQVNGCASARFTISRLADGKGVRFVGLVRLDAVQGVYPLSGTAGDVLAILFPKVS